ncbi:hypothetical protein [Extensimonas vulgaris]|uniref:Uncharacterized protein n=1 Tax=Extensimonas vulgaris TaxID=1031594 RepID=A0A369AGJ1_9BURK|nr:hypothetical protein [Extensimonas vulgaris]RCX08253.1 hypothetical protein DFR45_10973 [Extensimonas vulgaris]TWI37475.1 hypothetical protein IP95_02031 [Extensimonas vulgaris]TXD13842.1 hypothetical protein FUT63_11350 [Extensimonas vulgaris]
MNVIVEINGRQAIPVRAIPLLTDWEVLSPDVCANAFAGEEGTTPHLEGLQAYRLDEKGAPQPIAAREWANWIVRELEACSERITATQTSHEDGYQQWRSESLGLLPAGVFVWRDEFEAAFLLEYGPESMRAQFDDEGYEQDRHNLNFDPQHGPRNDWETLVMEGFAPAQHQAAAPAPVEPVVTALTQEQRQAKRWQMCIDAELAMPTDTYAHLPRGIGKVAKELRITRQALQQDLNAHRERLFGK